MIGQTRDHENDVEMLSPTNLANLADLFAINCAYRKSFAQDFHFLTYSFWCIKMSTIRRTAPRAEGTIVVADEIAPAQTLPTVDSKITRKLPTPVQLLLVVIISFSTSYVLFQTLGPLTNYELSGVSKHANSAEDYAVFPLLKVLELALGWLVGFDGMSGTNTGTGIDTDAPGRLRYGVSRFADAIAILLPSHNILLDLAQDLRSRDRI